MHKPTTSSSSDPAQTAWDTSAGGWGGAIARSGYQITEQIYTGSRTLVYRAIRESDRNSVILKLLRNEMPTFSELAQFRNQYAIMRGITAPNAKSIELQGIIQAYSLEHCGNGWLLVMEDFGGISVSQFTQGHPLDIATFSAIAIQLADILHHLYQHRVIHKDIKPANILIHPETKQIKLIDFSIASLLPRETQEIQNLNVLEGTLAYLSPEQTGRMNRGIDYRSDFYGLGVTFYELLAGQVPFLCDDAMELIHCHLAVSPIPVHQVNPEVPAVLSEIVAKLMAKNAEDRYQSALGLKHDLEICLQQWQQTGTIADLAIAKHDRCDRFIIPEKLYGRAAEVAALLSAFDRVASGSSELMLVAGFSGIGKTAAINEVHKPIIAARGYFIKGKYDQLQRNIPFSAFVQSFRDLMEQLLGESKAQLAQWRTKVLQAVGENGQVIIDVIPQLEQIIGKQPPVPELSGSAAQNRFNLLFQNFVQVFTTKQHPLVIFLDDLQWADSASLNLLKMLLGETETRYLLLLGAYRDNEVFPAHPLMLALEEITKAQAIVNTITLAPLNQAELNQLVADTLNSGTKLAQPLTELTYQKTKGNPFFATQFLKALHSDSFVSFNLEEHYWECDLVQVTAAAITSDVVEFMAAQLQKLPVETQEMLKLAACIGNSFDLTTLAIVSEKLQTETAADLWKALQSGLILPISETYKFFQYGDGISPQETWADYRFLHDRVQQATYSLIPESEKNSTHLKIGQLLLEKIPQSTLKENIFDIVNHLNIGSELIGEPSQLEQLANLNLMAGQKAKAATAYVDAVRYLNFSLGLLKSEHWQSHYDLMLLVHIEAAEAEYLNTNFPKLDNLAQIVLQQAKTALDQMKIYELQIHSYQLQSLMLKAIDTGLEALEKLGICLTENISDRPMPDLPRIEDLDSIPEMTNQHQLTALRIMMALYPPIYIAKPYLIRPLTLTMVQLSIEGGHSALAAYSYVLYGIILCTKKEKIEHGYHAGQLALKLLDKFHAVELKAKIYVLFNGHIRFWKEPADVTISAYLEAYQSGIETGDIEWASYSCMHYCQNLFLVGQYLELVEKKQAQYLYVIVKNHHEFASYYAKIWVQIALNLQGKANDTLKLTGNDFDESLLIPLWQSNKNYMSLFALYLAKANLLYLFDDVKLALDYALMAREYIEASIGLLTIGVYNFYLSLILLAAYPQAETSQQQQYLSDVEENQENLGEWLTHAPQNFHHKYLLVEAEKFRVLGNNYQAGDLYDRAISLAKANGYIQEEALANELAAKFYLGWGKEKVASGYMQEAYYCYSRWGAKAKVEDLTARYGQLLSPILQRAQISDRHGSLTGSINTHISPEQTVSSICSSSVSKELDLNTVLKAAQALSSEIDLDKLLATLMQVIVENSGADKAALFVASDGELETAVEYLDRTIRRLSPQPVDECSNFPPAAIHYVERTLETVITDANSHPSIARDRYFTQHQPLSLLCTPILNQSKLIGVLYLENSLTKGAFTQQRIELLKLLCSQTAISLKNAQLYQQSQTYAQKLEQSLEELQLSEARYRYLTTATSQIVWLASPEGENLNTVHWRAYTGQTEEEVKGTGWLNALHPDDIEGTTKVRVEAVTKKSLYNTEYRIRGADGIYRYFAVRGVPLLAEDGSIREWIGTCTDIDARKQAEERLLHKSQQLEQTLKDLQTMQLQLVQNEKMSALGNLVAGIAHEINNPVGFLKGNIQPALDYITDLFCLLDLYQEKYPVPDAEIEDEIAAIDLDFLREDLPKLVGSMREGVDRIANISTSLRTFSRADSDIPVTFNLHEGLDSTILILKHRLKANENRPEIKVIKNYNQIPHVKCFAGQLNQVFVNLLANAIDALEESNIGRSFAEIEANPNLIAITTEFLEAEHQVLVRIKDNGTGIPESVKHHIFDHLFTTKAVGKGTGLGLAIAHQIVTEKHQGWLELNSTLGQGSEFIMALPVT
ncbi:AAA family ATPase [Microcoleus sp. bin38.metabat.b11b12b14.051]|uniref:AAA family ATPase n=1 Tax=Microcoleus sp. bin38.metabat.b11b12b14.051 TaxID=2742709 RepID=UPI0025DD3D39|nr:AAA family ATPase [Microcoleus sp. bin38.metabat.b11b12b14.051]